MKSRKVDVLVVGGGIVGLATALRLLEMRPSTRLVLVEKEDSLAQHQTGHNSGVIHSGLYYKPGSRKARECRLGYDDLLAFCRTAEINHDLCGKVVVATTEDEVLQLEQLFQRGVANGLTGIRRLSPGELREIEPNCVGKAALFVPQTGIVDYATVAKRIGDKIRGLGAEIRLGERVESITRTESLVCTTTPTSVHESKMVVTCAGLQSDRLARQTDPSLNMRIVPFRGEYFTLTPEARGLVRNLIYPVPDLRFPFLGVHFTRRIDGNIECGPNAVFSLHREGYGKIAFNFRDTVESLAWPGFRTLVKRYWRPGLEEFRRSFNKGLFTAALQRLVPDIREEDILPGGAGIRAQACWRDGTLVDDFHTVDAGNVLHVCNAPSPAATAALAIGRTIARSVENRLA